MRFDKENLSTRKFGTEFFITVLSIVAEFELRNMSEAVKFGYRHRAKNGSVEVSRILGYNVSYTETWTINHEQAATVRRIFELYLQGHGVAAICKILENEGRKTRTGNMAWGNSTIYDILRNEKYIGDAKAHKTTTNDQLKKAKNTSIPHVYIRDNHPDHRQTNMETRANRNRQPRTHKQRREIVWQILEQIRIQHKDRVRMLWWEMATMGAMVQGRKKTRVGLHKTPTGQIGMQRDTHQGIGT